MTAEMRARAVSFKMLLGVRFKTSIKSCRVVGVYFGGFTAGFLGRYFSSLESSQRTKFCIKFSNMIYLLYH